METMDIALNIRSLREKHGLTLESLATAVGVTKGFLSQVENFRALPSVPLIYKIAAVFGVEPGTLLTASEDAPRCILTRQGQGVVVEREYPESGFIYRALAKGKTGKSMEPFLLEIPPQATRKSVCTNGNEFIYLLEGQIHFHLGDEVIVMNTGDSLYFDGEIAHFPKNIGAKPAFLLVVYSISH